MQWCQIVTLKSAQCHPDLTYIFNFRHSGTLALRAERHREGGMMDTPIFETWLRPRGSDPQIFWIPISTLSEALEQTERRSTGCGMVQRQDPANQYVTGCDEQATGCPQATKKPAVLRRRFAYILICTSLVLFSICRAAFLAMRDTGLATREAGSAVSFPRTLLKSCHAPCHPAAVQIIIVPQIHPH